MTKEKNRPPPPPQAPMTTLTPKVRTHPPEKDIFPFSSRQSLPAGRPEEKKKKDRAEDAAQSLLVSLMLGDKPKPKLCKTYKLCMISVALK